MDPRSSGSALAEFSWCVASNAGRGPSSTPERMGSVSDTTPDMSPDLDTDEATEFGQVNGWLDWQEAAVRIGVPASKVRQLIKEHQLAAVVPVPGKGPRVPAEFVDTGEIVKGVSGGLTVLHDGGYDDRQAVTWLVTPDETLPGRPIDALRENRGAEVKRRAQAMAF